MTATAFDMAASITDGSNTAAFTYDSENARYKMVTTGITAATTYYLNDPISGAMEEEVVAGGTTTWNDYIKGDGVQVAEGTCVGAPPCAAGDTFVNFVVDHLGSVAVIFNPSGVVLQRLNYDAWGKSRNADGTAIDCTAGSAPPSSVTRGFTGQEMLDGVCLINMNARIYDPSLGRFMSADSMVGDATIPQELNRFTYVLNNPLSMTDPSGHGFLSILRDVAAIFVVIFLQQEEILPWLEGFSATQAAFLPAYVSAINAGILGGIGGLISTGSLKGSALDALQGGLFNVAGDFLQPGGALGGARGFLGIGHSATVFIAHGLVGGMVTEIGGGRFSSGFLAGGISSFAPAPVNDQTWEQTADGAIVAAALGGVGSVVGGGKFDNGAVTGAFAYLLNALQHSIDQHAIAVRQEVGALKAQGYTILGEEVTATTPGLLYSRRYDILILDPITEQIFGVEVKSTSTRLFKLNSAQVDFDTRTVEFGAETKSGLNISGVIYIGVCVLCEVDSLWRSITLFTNLQEHQIPFKVGAPRPSPRF